MHKERGLEIWGGRESGTGRLFGGVERRRFGCVLFMASAAWGVDGPPGATGVLSGRGGQKRGSVLRCINTK